MLKLPMTARHERPVTATQHAANISRRSTTAHTAHLERRLQADRQDGEGQAVQLRPRTISRLDSALVYRPIKHHTPPHVETRLRNEIRVPARTDDATGHGRSTQEPKRRHPISHACESARGRRLGALGRAKAKATGTGEQRQGRKKRRAYVPMTPSAHPAEQAAAPTTERPHFAAAALRVLMRDRPV